MGAEGCIGGLGAGGCAYGEGQAGEGQVWVKPREPASCRVTRQTSGGRGSSRQSFLESREGGRFSALSLGEVPQGLSADKEKAGQEGWALRPGACNGA